MQNAVDCRDLGVATAGSTLFRSIGGAVGTAVLGAVFIAAVSHGLPAGAELPNLQEMTQLPADACAAYAGVLTQAMALVFRVAAVIGLIGFALSWLLPPRALRETLAATTGDVGDELGQAMAMPRSPLPEDDCCAAWRMAGKGLVLHEPSGRWELTRAGCASLEQVVQARRKHLEALFAEWSPQHQSDLAELLRRLGPQILPAARRVA